VFVRSSHCKVSSPRCHTCVFTHTEYFGVSLPRRRSESGYGVTESDCVSLSAARLNYSLLWRMPT
jgi:hypothetical protein